MLMLMASMYVGVVGGATVPEEDPAGGGDGELSSARGQRGGGGAGCLGLELRSASCVEECEACPPQATRFFALTRRPHVHESVRALISSHV